MRKRDGDEYHATDPVDDVRLLHRGADLLEVREQHDEARHAQDRAQHHHAQPEPALLARIEATRRHFVFAEHAAGLHQPGQVALGREVGAHVDQREQHGGNKEQRPDEIVQVLHQHGQPRKQRVADHGQQDVLAEQDHQARHAEHAEADRHAPMGPALHCGEAQHRAAGRRIVELDRPLPEVERANHHGGEHHQQPAVESDRAVAVLAPCLARRGHAVLAEELRLGLDEHAGFGPLDAGVVRFAGANFAPHRGVVARLLDLAFGLRILGGWLRRRHGLRLRQSRGRHQHRTRQRHGQAHQPAT